MLYLSLILIATGIFFIIYTMLIKAKKDAGILYSKKVSESASPVINEKLQNRSKKIAEKISKSGSDFGQKKSTDRNFTPENISYKADDSENDSFEDNVKKVDNEIYNEVYDIEEKFENNRMSEDFPVVMYEDSSNIIDYSNNDSIIDSTLREYKKIRRVGAGNLEISEDGVNFRAGKKLFRFDFRRIADIKSGNNFFVLLMKGSDVSKLFLFKKDTEVSEKLKKFYNKYSSNVL
ncbi:MAG: hypothetical protein JXN64_01700 [Spirochaetes bacterium]|nr:hypothetical protein [Spirochaetota bacterium]